MKKESAETATPDDVITELTALAGAGAIDGADAAALEHCLECPLGKAVVAREGFEDVSAAILSILHAPVEPPAGLKEKIFAQIEKEEEPKVKGGYHFIGSDEGDWQSLPGGKVRVKTLSDLEEAGHTLLLLEVAPGGMILPHAHQGMEEVYLLSGDLTTVGRTLQAGDYLRAEPGTFHMPAKSENGCRALIVTARENHHRKAISAYDGLAKMLKGLGSKS